MNFRQQQSDLMTAILRCSARGPLLDEALREATRGRFVASWQALTRAAELDEQAAPPMRLAARICIAYETAKLVGASVRELTA